MKKPLPLAPTAGRVVGCATSGHQHAQPRGRWAPQEADAWYEAKPWLVGCNFNPSSAINQLEMWQADTFDLVTMDRELGWAETLGFNSVRVYIHHLLWEQDSASFLKRLGRFLDLAERHGIGVVFVLLDGVWDPFPKLGKQRDPKPHLHNSGWVQSPGVELLKDPARHDELKPYIQGVVGRFRADPRIHAWDIFNEPENMNPAYGKHEPANKLELATVLLIKALAWVREVGPTQPVTAAVWLGDWGDPARLSPIEKVMLNESDVLSFHNYGPLDHVQTRVENLRRYNRPILCTEYMARPNGSTFDPLLGYFKEQRVGAYNWGLVAGKTQTIYPWESWLRTFIAEPPVWFHDIFLSDGTPFDPREVRYIKGLTGKGRRSPGAVCRETLDLIDNHRADRWQRQKRPT